MLTLYQFDSCPFCWKVKALLNYTQHDYEIVEVTPFSMKEIEFTDHKKVPVLKDDEKIIVESAAIVKYINDNYAKLPISDDDHIWEKWVDDKLVFFLPPLIHPSVATSFKNFGKIIHPGQFSWFKSKLMRVVGSFIMAKKVAPKMIAEHGIKDLDGEFLAAIDHWVAEGLNGKAYHGGEATSYIDCSVFGVLRAGHDFGVIDKAKAHNADFAVWYEACFSRMNA